MAELWIGTSGYVYRHWRGGVFYPPGLPAKDELAWYATRFGTVELNNPFYRVLQERASVLGSRLGPLLVQLPPQLHLDLQLLEEFLAGLSAAHRWVIEFQHPSWQVAPVYDALGRRRVALCVPVGGRVSPHLVTTVPFTYIRMHAGSVPGGAFGEDALRAWAGRIRALRRTGKSVYVYFNNDREGHAPGSVVPSLRLDGRGTRLIVGSLRSYEPRCQHSRVAYAPGGANRETG